MVKTLEGSITYIEHDRIDETVYLYGQLSQQTNAGGRQIHQSGDTC